MGLGWTDSVTGCVIWTAPVEQHSHAKGLQVQQCDSTRTKSSVEDANVLSSYLWAEQGSLTIAQIPVMFPSSPACTQTRVPRFLHKHMSAGDRLSQHRIKGKTMALLGSFFPPSPFCFSLSGTTNDIPSGATIWTEFCFAATPLCPRSQCSGNWNSLLYRIAHLRPIFRI